jgi:hypothetical protein
MPDVVTTNRGTQITSRDFELALSYHGVKQQYTAVESHHSLGANERAHAVLRRVYLKTRHDHPKLLQELALAYSQKAINESIGTDGIVPTLLVYGSMPRFRAAGLDARLQPNSERFHCMATARAEHTRIVNHQPVQRLLRTRVPPAADRQLHIGQHVFVWRVKERKHCGPFATLNLPKDGTQVTLNVDRVHRSDVFSADCVRPAPEMADVLLANISSTLSSYSNRAPGCTGQCTQKTKRTSQSSYPKLWRIMGLHFPQPTRRSYWACLSAGLSKLCVVRRSPRMLRS